MASGINRGDEFYVSVRINRTLVADFIGKVISPTEVSVEVYISGGEDEIAIFECVKAAYSTMDWQLQRPRLKELLQERIAQLRRLDEEAEREDPPAPTIEDLPF